MKYFLLEEDERLTEKIEFKNYTTNQSKDMETMIIHETMIIAEKAPDYVKKRFLMDMRHIVSEKIDDVLCIYNSSLEKKLIIVMDKEREQQFLYYEIKPQLHDCIKNTKYKKAENLRLYRDKLNNEPIFLATLEKMSFVFVRFDVAESIMKRQPLGIKFMPIPIE